MADNRTSLPVSTPEQRAGALEASRQARARRAVIKQSLASGDVMFDDILSSGSPIVRRTRVRELLLALPGVGPKTADAIMASCHVPDERRVGGLGTRQRENLAAAVGKASRQRG